MLVYRQTARPAATACILSDLRAQVHRLRLGGITSHEQAQDLLIAFGQFEAGVADALFADADGISATTSLLRRAGLLTGQVLYDSWRGRDSNVSGALSSLAQHLDELCSHSLPQQISIVPPEGYSHYGLYPESYLEAAEVFLRDNSSPQIVCIGIRSIGTSLSSAVGAVLESNGRKVASFSVRPVGHPFDRRLEITGELERLLLKELPDSSFAVIDEGPGLSGSSLTCVADKLSSLGIPDSRIVFFPGWAPDGSNFVYGKARDRWRLHAKFCRSFDQVWIDSGRFGPFRSNLSVIDVSAGRWRSLTYSNARSYPAVQPQHERREFLMTEHLPHAADAKSAFRHLIVSSDIGRSGEVMLLKFAGIGRLGRTKLERARLLAKQGFGPEVLGFSDGFLITRFAGLPVKGRADDALLAYMADYLAHLRRCWPAEASVSSGELVQMMRVNVEESLGREWLAGLSGVERLAGDDLQASALDARVQPHEWLATSRGYIKADGIDHHADHFLPGCQSVAWDLAGIFVEFGLSARQRQFLMREFTDFSGDREIEDALPFFLCAYVAFRLGYAAMAKKACVGTAEGARFAKLEARYRDQLKTLLAGP